MNDTTDATAIFAPLWKRKWLILIVGVLVAAATYAYYKHKPPVYGASTEIYLGAGSEVQSLISGTAGKLDPERSSTRRSGRTHQLQRRGRSGSSGGCAKNTSSLRPPARRRLHPPPRSDFITSLRRPARPRARRCSRTPMRRSISANETPATAVRCEAVLASATPAAAEQRTEALGGSFAGARPGSRRTDQPAPVRALAWQHRATSRSTRRSPTPLPLSPKPKRNAIFGFVLGIVLAAIAAYALSRFDRRLRSLADIEAVFQAPVLTAVPSIRRPIIRRDDGQPAPAQALREPLRRLHTTLQLRGMPDDLDRRSVPRSVLFISADAGDGKSTLIAGLALVQSEAGARVAIVESDLRRPIQAELLGVDGSQGLAEVLAGALTVQEAMQRVQALPARDSGQFSRAVGEGVATAVQPRATGSVSVLPSGGTVANPPALLAGRAMPDAPALRGRATSTTC